jgi:hypothetical protein
LAVALLDKAIAMNAGWKAPLCAAHICMNYTKDYGAAERYLEVAAKDPAAPFYARTALTSARCEAVAHDPVKSIDIWYDEFTKSPASDRDLRHSAAVRIVQYAADMDSGPDPDPNAGTETAAPRKPTAEERARVTKILDEVRSAIVAKESPTTAPTTNPTI